MTSVLEQVAAVVGETGLITDREAMERFTTAALQPLLLCFTVVGLSTLQSIAFSRVPRSCRKMGTMAKLAPVAQLAR